MYFKVILHQNKRIIYFSATNVLKRPPVLAQRHPWIWDCEVKMMRFCTHRSPHREDSQMLFLRDGQRAVATQGA